MTTPLTVITLLKLKPSPNGEQHGERPFWREHGERYLNAWVAGVRQYIPSPKRIVIMTDSSYGLHIDNPPDGPRIDVVPLDFAIDAPGFWAKLNMFREGVSAGLTLYSDLDNVFCGDLSELVNLTPDPLIMTDDRHIPGMPNGSLMLFDAERCRGIWEDYSLAPRSFERSHVVVGNDYTRAFDQAFIAEWLKGFGFDVPLFQERLPLGYLVNAYSELPRCEEWRTARVIFGCGPAKIHTSKHPGYMFAGREVDCGL